jgi:hypothetical protein
MLCLVTGKLYNTLSVCLSYITEAITNILLSQLQSTRMKGTHSQKPIFIHVSGLCIMKGIF